MLPKFSLKIVSLAWTQLITTKKNHELDLNAGYQREEVWKDERKRKLIKSLILGIPIPSIIFNDKLEDQNNPRMVVIDGKQRCISIIKFLESKLTIPGEWVEENKKKYYLMNYPV